MSYGGSVVTVTATGYAAALPLASRARSVTVWVVPAASRVATNAVASPAAVPTGRPSTEIRYPATP